MTRHAQHWEDMHSALSGLSWGEEVGISLSWVIWVWLLKLGGLGVIGIVTMQLNLWLFLP